jgi:HAE1 family hydrophobic/amphiphilic exporter-1
MSKFFIRRPIVAMVIAIVMVVVGLVSLATLPVAQFPSIVPPEIQISANYPGADAQTLEQSVAAPLEAQITGVDNMNFMYSVNANNGQTQITVDFDVKTDPNIDQVLTQLRTSQAQSQLPAQVNTAGLTIRKSPTAPLMLVALYSPHDTYDNVFLANYAYINLVDELTRVPGISQINVFGAGQYAMRTWVKPDQLAKLQVTVPQIIQALQAQNNVNPAGQIGGEPVPEGQQFTYTVRTQGRLLSPEQFGNIILRANPDGSILRLKDVARIELGAQLYNMQGRYNGKPSAILACYQLPGSNAVDAANGLRARIAELSKKFPNDLAYTVSLDTTASVTAGMHEILMTLLEALGLVVLVVYLFLQGWRASLIPLMAVPVSLVGTFAVFPLLGFSINTLSLFGLVLAIGLVVDDAIVVVEAVERHIEEGMSPRDASVFIGGITGRLYQQFAVTIAISVLFSAFNALSLSPAMSALLLRPKNKNKKPGLLGRFFGLFNRAFSRATEGYVGISAVLIRKAVVALVLLGAISTGAVLIGRHLPNSFLPEEDYGYVYVNLQLPYAASLQRTSDAAHQVEDMILHTPGVAGCTSVIGLSLLSRVQNTYSAFFFVTEKPWDERKKPEEQYTSIQSRITAALAKLPDGVGFSFSPPAIPGVGTSGGVTFMLEDRSGSDLSFLTENVNKFVSAASLGPLLRRLPRCGAIPFGMRCRWHFRWQEFPCRCSWLRRFSS